MPIIKSAVKRMKQTATRRQRNIATKRAIKASTKAFAAEPSAAALSQAQSELDKAVKKGLLKKTPRAAARHRSPRLPRLLASSLRKAIGARAYTKTPRERCFSLLYFAYLPLLIATCH